VNVNLSLQRDNKRSTCRLRSRRWRRTWSRSDSCWRNYIHWKSRHIFRYNRNFVV